MMHLILIFVGGGLGAVARFAMTKWLEDMHSTLSIGTIVSNILSCVILGFVIGYSARFSIAKEMQSLVLIGFCGGFSTFSTFSYENYKLLVEGSYGLFVFNVLFSVSICIGAILLGLRIVRMAY